MAGGASLGIGAIPPTTQPLTKTEYEPAFQNYLVKRIRLMKILESEGTADIDSSFIRREFAFQTEVVGGTRSYGSTACGTQLETCTEGPAWCNAIITHKRLVNATRICEDTRNFTPGLMGDPIKNTLTGLAEDWKAEWNRMALQTTGNAVLFQIRSVDGQDANGNWVYGIQNLGGLAGQQIGHIVKNLNLQGVLVQAASAPDVAGPQSTPSRVVSVSPVLGNETITVNSRLDTVGSPAQAGWIVFRSRVQNGNVQPSTDGLTGLPVLVDNGNRMNPLQNVDVLNAVPAAGLCYAPNWIAQVFGLGGVPAALDETRMINAITAAEIYGACQPDDEIKLPYHFFLMNTKVFNAYAQQYLNLRMIVPSQMWDGSGVNVQGGINVRTKAPQVNGYPIWDEPLAQQNSAYFLSAKELKFFHNGPKAGQFYTVQGMREIPVPCTLDAEIKWLGWSELVVGGGRNTMVRLDDVATPSFM